MTSPDSASTSQSPQISPFTLGEFQTNCFLITVFNAEENASDCWIVDCGFQPQPMLDHIDAQGLRPRGILLTHAHADHIAGVDEVLARYGKLPIHLHEGEKGFCSDPMLNLSGMMGMHVTCTEPENWLKDGDELQLGSSSWRVAHTPGHSPGSSLFICDEAKVALVGDTLFAGSIGRVDFPTSSPDAMRRSLTEVVMELPDDTMVDPGHMMETTIGREKATNPYLVEGF